MAIIVGVQFGGLNVKSIELNGQSMLKVLSLANKIKVKSSVTYEFNEKNGYVLRVYDRQGNKFIYYSFTERYVQVTTNDVKIERLNELLTYLDRIELTEEER